MEIILPSNIKFIREKFNLSQEELAKLIKKKKSVIGNYEKGISSPNLDSLIKISNYFGISLDDLVCSDLKQEEEKLLKFINSSQSSNWMAEEPGISYVRPDKTLLTQEQALEEQEKVIEKLSEEVRILKEEIGLFSIFHQILLRKYDDIYLKLKNLKITGSF